MLPVQSTILAQSSSSLNGGARGPVHPQSTTEVSKNRRKVRTSNASVLSTKATGVKQQKLTIPLVNEKPLEAASMQNNLRQGEKTSGSNNGVKSATVLRPTRSVVTL